MPTVARQSTCQVASARPAYPSSAPGFRSGPSHPAARGRRGQMRRAVGPWSGLRLPLSQEERACTRRDENRLWSRAAVRSFSSELSVVGTPNGGNGEGSRARLARLGEGRAADAQARFVHGLGPCARGGGAHRQRSRLRPFPPRRPAVRSLGLRAGVHAARTALEHPQCSVPAPCPYGVDGVLLAGAQSQREAVGNAVDQLERPGGRAHRVLVAHVHPP